MKTYFNEPRASFDTRLFCASLAEGEISIWETESFQRIAVVRPGFSGGQQRYIVDRVNHTLYSGTWEDGLTAYDYGSGQPLWKRTDLIGIQRVDMSAAYPTSLFVQQETPDFRADEANAFFGVVELNAHSGETIWKRPRASDIFVHSRHPVLVIDDRAESRIVLLDGDKKKIGETERRHFALLDVAFNDGLIGLAEGPKGMRVIDHSGKLVCENVARGREPHCSRITFHEDRVIVFDSWEGSYMTVIDPATGHKVSEYESKFGGEPCFIDHGSRFVNAFGQVFHSRTGEFATQIEAEPTPAASGKP